MISNNLANHAAVLKQQQMDLMKATNAAQNLHQTHDARQQQKPDLRGEQGAPITPRTQITLQQDLENKIA